MDLATKPDWPASASVMVSVPLAVWVPSSVTLPRAVPPITGASLVPVTTVVSVWWWRFRPGRRRRCS